MLPMQTKMTFIADAGGVRTRAVMLTAGVCLSKQPRPPLVFSAFDFGFEDSALVRRMKSH
jgi:hypothetical protein